MVTRESHEHVDGHVDEHVDEHVDDLEPCAGFYFSIECCSGIRCQYGICIMKCNVIYDINMRCLLHIS